MPDSREEPQAPQPLRVDPVDEGELDTLITSPEE